MILAFAGVVAGQNPPSRTSASAVDNEQIRVIKVVQQPHQKTRPHQHNMNRVMLYLTAGTQVNDYEGRKEVLNFEAGQALWSAAGGMHVAEVTSADADHHRRNGAAEAQREESRDAARPCKSGPEAL